VSTPRPPPTHPSAGVGDVSAPTLFPSRRRGPGRGEHSLTLAALFPGAPAGPRRSSLHPPFSPANPGPTPKKEKKCAAPRTQFGPRRRPRARPGRRLLSPCSRVNPPCTSLASLPGFAVRALADKQPGCAGAWATFARQASQPIRLETCAYTQAHSITHTHTHTHTHARTHARTHAPHARACAHTHNSPSTHTTSCRMQLEPIHTHTHANAHTTQTHIPHANAHTCNGGAPPGRDSTRYISQSHKHSAVVSIIPIMPWQRLEIEDQRNERGCNSISTRLRPGSQ
jgi:hypothetical protein